MVHTRRRVTRNWVSKYVLSLVIAVGYVGTSSAQQFDAPYDGLQKRNKDRWAAEDKHIRDKLAPLEKKIGKKPNIN